MLAAAFNFCSCRSIRPSLISPYTLQTDILRALGAAEGDAGSGGGGGGGGREKLQVEVFDHPDRVRYRLKEQPVGSDKSLREQRQQQTIESAFAVSKRSAGEGEKQHLDLMAVAWNAAKPAGTDLCSICKLMERGGCIAPALAPTAAPRATRWRGSPA